MLSCLSRVRLFTTPWTVPPGSSVHGVFPGENTGVGCHFLLQGIFLTHAGRFLTTGSPGKPLNKPELASIETEEYFHFFKDRPGTQGKCLYPLH